MTARRASVVALAGVVAAFLATAAVGATSPWVTRANAVCAVWNRKAVATIGTATPKTQAQLFAYMVKTRPIEAGLLRGLEAISARRPAGASHLFALAAADIRELDAALAAYRNGNKAAFDKKARIWRNDHRTSEAAAAVGLRACG